MTTAGQHQCRIVTNAILLVIFIGVVAWLFNVYGAFADAIACVVEQYYVLKSITQGSFGAWLQPSLAQIPALLITGLESVGHLMWALVIPAVIVWLCQICLIISSCKAKKSNRGFSSCVTKGFIFLIIIFGLIGFALYLVVGVIGLASQAPPASYEIENFQNWCAYELPASETELSGYEATADRLIKLGVDSQELKDAQVDLDASRRGVDALTAICTCTESLWAALANLGAAAIASAIVALAVIIANCCTCCQMGCCCRNDDEEKDKGGVTMKGVEGDGITMTGV